MADIQIQCEQCGQEVTLSQYADPSAVVCRVCGQRLRQPGMAAPPPPMEKESLKLRPRTVVVDARDLEAEAETMEVTNKAWFRKAPKKKVGMTHALIGWGLFLVLGAGMGTLRYGDVLSPSNMSLLQEFGPYIFIAVNIVIVLMAFTDQIFQGILVLLVPFYSIFYIFMISDKFIVRALFAGLLVGIGQDSLIWFQATSGEVIESVQTWIETGGGY